MTLNMTYKLDLMYGTTCQMSRRKIISFESYRSDAHTQPSDCYVHGH